VGIPFIETRVTLAELQAADEAILVGTSTEIMPVATVDGKPIGTGKPGPIAARLQAAYVQELEAWLAEAPAPGARKAPATAS
jgi:D-alanine transaminase